MTKATRRSAWAGMVQSKRRLIRSVRWARRRILITSIHV
jgi:hypothetical protein